MFPLLFSIKKTSIPRSHETRTEINYMYTTKPKCRAKETRNNYSSMKKSTCIRYMFFREEHHEERKENVEPRQAILLRQRYTCQEEEEKEQDAKVTCPVSKEVHRGETKSVG